jgi:hypothetical protein
MLGVAPAQQMPERPLVEQGQALHVNVNERVRFEGIDMDALRLLQGLLSASLNSQARELSLDDDDIG